MNYLQYESKRVIESIFGEMSVTNITERQYRFLEESIELIQSLGFDKLAIFEIVDYVYNRPDGEPQQELGGTIVTLCALATSLNLSVELAGINELYRINTPEMIEKLREKQAAKPDVIKSLK